MEHIDMKCSLDSKLQIDFICSIRIPSRNRDIIEKPVQLIRTPVYKNFIVESYTPFILSGVCVLLTILTAINISFRIVQYLRA